MLGYGRGVDVEDINDWSRKSVEKPFGRKM
jgi:hypothetical protein